MRAIRLSLVVVALASTIGLGCIAPAAEPALATPAPAILPLRTLRLYETGVGYFERSGTVEARAITTLPVPAGHLDDALASLVVLGSAGGGTVTGLSFASSVTRATARSRAGLPPDPASRVGFRDLLDSMKGEKVAISSRDLTDTLVGRVVEVGMEVDEARARALAEIKDAKHDEPPVRLVVTLLTADGEVAVVPAESIVRVRPVDPAFAARLDAALNALGTRSTQNSRALRLLGDTRGPVTFGYVAETPIWRATYRLIVDVRPDAGTSDATLQGWALLHNDTDENWHDVHLELVNGEPDSFLVPLAAPRYARRSLLHPEAPLSTLPQLQDTSADALWGDHVNERPSGKDEANANDRTRSRLALLAETTLADSDSSTEQKAIDGRIYPKLAPQGRPTGQARLHAWHGAGRPLRLCHPGRPLARGARVGARAVCAAGGLGRERRVLRGARVVRARRHPLRQYDGADLADGHHRSIRRGGLHRRDVSRAAQAW